MSYFADLCRLVRQVKEFGRWSASQLLHLPDEPAGVRCSRGEKRNFESVSDAR